MVFKKMTLILEFFLIIARAKISENPQNRSPKLKN